VPEGDTVHRAAGRLRVLVGQRLTVEAVHPRARATGVAERLDGRRLEAVEARGKNLLLRFEGGRVLRSHLGMSGSWRTMDAHAPVRGAPWIMLTGERAKAVLRGGAVLETSARHVWALGPDILAPEPDLDAIVSNLRRIDQRRTVGEALLDQRAVAGIGNIWRSEALWHARVSPWLQLGELEDRELHGIVREAARLMAESRDGGHPRREVYRRRGRPCRRCGEPLKSAKQGEAARTVYWCPACQRGEERPGA
jgi:endonuclease VIII